MRPSQVHLISKSLRKATALRIFGRQLRLMEQEHFSKKAMTVADLTLFWVARMKQLVILTSTRRRMTVHASPWTSAVYAAVTVLPKALVIAMATVLQQATTVTAIA